MNSTNPNIVCVIFKDHSLVIGDTASGLTLYASPGSPNAMNAWAVRKNLGSLVRFANKALRAEYPNGTEATRSMVAFPEYHARNWVRLNEDPRKWNLPLVDVPDVKEAA